MPYALGFDSSTQSLSAVLLDLETNHVSHELGLPFGELTEYASPRGFLGNLPEGQVHADPRLWVAALDMLVQRMKDEGWPLHQVVAISGSGQQHGSVYLKAGFADRLAALDPAQPLTPQLEGIYSRATSPIWMDGSTSAECAEIAAALGGADIVCARSGSVAVERFTGPQIRAFSKRDPQGYADTARIHLVSSFLCSLLIGADAPIDTGDGAGMNLMNLAAEEWDTDLLNATAPDLASKLPPVSPASKPCGTVSPWFVKRFGFAPTCIVLPFSGDNPSSLVGMGAATPGRVVVSLGTSDTLFAAMTEPRTDPEGCGHVFGNPLGGYMTLACIRNGSLAREAFRDQLGADWSAFEAAGDAELPDTAFTIPFVADEITPKRHGGLIESEPALTTPQRVRAFLEGQAFNLLRQLEWMHLKPTELCLTGGASRNEGIARIFADVFGVPVSRLSVSNSAALGAAMRAAIASGTSTTDLVESLSHPDSSIQPKERGTAPRYGAWLASLKATA
ncbi:carbohydrate kinase [Luteolibacter ambystomatis]|uniref:Carbohydrate kinase n=1 Tax=Luteolibacter ambystomatis TaxID=2824561 RepID=A0A975J0Y0_9BACT|nr:FGGY-family carbohydrate kinase [Luteolibacter ambystomatis]QUE52005.1 carbohydrate kinase [Luteolibacter ambystomatis]